MGQVAKKYCDKIYITDDNPRKENAKKIRKEIMKVLKKSSAKEIGDRKKAIIYAMKNSDPYEIILIAGKGHETYQDLGNKKIFFSDKNIIKNFKNKNILTNSKINNLKYNSLILRKTLQSNKNYFFDNVSIDSRTIKRNNLFIALKGKNKDGHNFLNQAYKNGASYCVVSKKNKKSLKLINVKNTMKFLKTILY